MATIQPPSLPYQASGTSFVVSRRLMVATTYETPFAFFRATSKTICWSVRNTFCWANDHALVLSAYADPTVSDSGQAQTPINLRVGSQTKATALVSGDPVVTDFGAYLASLKTAMAPATSGLLMLIDPGHSLLVTATASTDQTDVGVGFSWYEVDLN